MQVILISSRLAKARSLTLSLRHVFAVAALAAIVLAGLTGALYWVSLRFAVDLKIPLVREMVLAAQQGESERSREFMQQNLNAMAVKIGEMQAQLSRLDALGERLSTMAGIRPADLRFSEKPGMGGAQSTTMPPQNLTLTEFSQRIANLSRQMENRSDMLGVLDAQLFEQTVTQEGDAHHDAGERASTTRRASACASIPLPGSRRCMKASTSSSTSARRWWRPPAAWCSSPASTRSTAT